MTKKEIENKVVKAQEAKTDWKFIGIKKRIEYLEQIYKTLEKHKLELGELATKAMGMPKKHRNELDIESALHYFEWYLKNSENHLQPEISYKDKKTTNTVYYEPIGVAAVIMPWNFPLSNFVWGVIPNLIVGNTVVFKHSEECTEFSQYLEKILSEETKIPNRVLNFVFGGPKEGDVLVHQNIDLICFTGSTKTGKYLYSVAAEKMLKIVLELGGSAAGIVYEDADLDTVWEAIYYNRFINSGQICDGLKRLIVHKHIHESLINKLKENGADLIVGDPQDPNTDVGPIVSKKQYQKLIEQLEITEKAGANIEKLSETSTKGYFYPPSIVTNVTNTMPIWNEEVFGPILPIMVFENDIEAIRLANETQYGLGGYVFTKDKEKARSTAESLNTGMVSINGSLYLNPSSPFGGCKMSGIGREHGKYGLHELCNIKVVAN